MEYNLKWVVLSNDDVFKVDDPSVLKSELMLIDSKINVRGFPKTSSKSFFITL